MVAGDGDQRRVLLITRSDIGVEAIPGGMVDEGEAAPAALVRELREETGVDLSDHQPTILGRDIVDDWRQSDHAWIASTSALFRLPFQVTALAADDAIDANWWPAATLDQLDIAITTAGRTLYSAHRPCCAAPSRVSTAPGPRTASGSARASAPPLLRRRNHVMADQDLSAAPLKDTKESTP